MQPQVGIAVPVLECLHRGECEPKPTVFVPLEPLHRDASGRSGALRCGEASPIDPFRRRCRHGEGIRIRFDGDTLDINLLHVNRPASRQLRGESTGCQPIDLETEVIAKRERDLRDEIRGLCIDCFECTSLAAETNRGAVAGNRQAGRGRSRSIDAQDEFRRLDLKHIHHVDIEFTQTNLSVNAERIHDILREHHERGSIPIGPCSGDRGIRKPDVQSVDGPPATGGCTERAVDRRVNEPHRPGATEPSAPRSISPEQRRESIEQDVVRADLGIENPTRRIEVEPSLEPGTPLADGDVGLDFSSLRPKHVVERRDSQPVERDRTSERFGDRRELDSIDDELADAHFLR